MSNTFPDQLRRLFPPLEGFDGPEVWVHLDQVCPDGLKVEIGAVGATKVSGEEGGVDRSGIDAFWSLKFVYQLENLKLEAKLGFLLISSLI